MLDKLTGRGWYYFLDGYMVYNQITIALKDQEKTTFTYLYGTFAFNRMSFRYCNTPTIFQRCIMFVLSNMVKDTINLFMDDF